MKILLELRFRFRFWLTHQKRKIYFREKYSDPIPEVRINRAWLQDKDTEITSLEFKSLSELNVEFHIGFHTNNIIGEIQPGSTGSTIQNSPSY